MDRKRWDIVIPVITIFILGILIIYALAKDMRKEPAEDKAVVATETEPEIATASEATPDEALEEPEPTKEVVHCLTTETTTQDETTEEITTEVFSATVTENITETYTEAETEEITEEMTTEAAEEYYEEPVEPDPPAEPSEPEPEGMTYLGTYWITGYTATGKPCANGNYPTVGYTVASNSLPMGTVIYIEGIGTRVVEDRGGMASNVIDVFVDSTSTAYAITGSYEVYIVE